MKERPILFSGPMIRALLDGRKTQTRRAVRTPPAGDWAVPGKTDCPYGQPGDSLWVRETWAWPGEEEVIYRADPESAEMVENWKSDPNFPQVHWRPSIFMPRRFSRITLKITGVRVERLSVISVADAIAEGVEPVGDGWQSYEVISIGSRKGKAHAVVPNRSPVTSYFELWKAINGGESLRLNPFVWVLTFDVVKS